MRCRIDARELGGDGGGGYLMERFGYKAEEVPECVGVLHVGGGVTLLRVN